MTSATTELRTQLQTWLASHVRPEPIGVSVRELFAWRLEWYRELAAAGWGGIDIPVEYGGCGYGIAERAMFIEEMARAEAPALGNWVGLELVAPTLIAADRQLAERYVPDIVRGHTIWAQAFSEPDAGSDLASVRTRASASDQGFVLAGTKKWTSWAGFADHLLVLARTGEVGDRHRSLTMFALPVDTVGVSVREVPMLYGDTEEFTVHLDDVVVGGEAVVGSVDAGWKTLMMSLALARGMSTVSRVEALTRQSNEQVAEYIADPERREGEQLWRLHARINALRALAYRKIAEIDPSGVPSRLASVEKLLWGELSSELGGYRVATGGVDAITVNELAVEHAGYALIRGMGAAIEGGTSEIQRNVLAQELLSARRK